MSFPRLLPALEFLSLHQLLSGSGFQASELLENRQGSSCFP